ncbi:MAG: NAD(P)-dependent oxidoreductase [Oscillospiraceae bacterium]|nr:NAD(P)-dependent oxidoreductase [Oscillospiraceae bacterium]
MSQRHYSEANEALLNIDFLPLENLTGKLIFVTGGTGLVGSGLIRVLLSVNRENNLGLMVYALVRNVQKAKDMLPSDSALILIKGDLEHLPEINVPIDYVVHSASPTASSFFMEHPVQTVKSAVCGTMNILDMAREKQVSSFVYLSSMEVYGENDTDEPLYEDHPVLAKPVSIRSCYPQSKLLCENLCVGYAHEYGLSCKAIRLAQTFGPGVPKNDNRVFAQFARSAIQKTDIVLQTPGLTKQTYLHTMDAVTAILTVLLKGEAGQVYNAANPGNYCSIRQMAELVAQKLANGEIAVTVNTFPEAAAKYPPTHKWNLSADKLMALGWHPTADLEQMYRSLIADMMENNGSKD